MEQCGGGVSEGSELCRQHFRHFHRKQVRNNFRHQGENGAVLGQRITPIERAGIYVPGGTAAYPSTVLMNAIPAKIAGRKGNYHGYPAWEGRKNCPSNPGGGGHRRGRSDFQNRRCAGRGSAGLRHGKCAQSGQNCRPRQYLRSNGKAQGLRQGRHRHDRGAVGNPRSGRRHRQIRGSWRRTCSPRRSMTGWPLPFSSPTSELLAKRLQEKIEQQMPSLIRQEPSPAESIDRNGRIFVMDAMRMPSKAVTPLRRSIWRSASTTRSRAQLRVRMRAAFSWARTCRRRWAITLPVPTTPCPPAARRGFPSPLGVDDFRSRSRALLLHPRSLGRVQRDASPILRNTRACTPTPRV